MTARSTEGPAWRRALVALGLVAVLGSTGCVAPFGKKTNDDGQARVGLPHPDMGITPEPLVDEEAPSTSETPAAPGSPGATGTTTTAAPGSPATTAITRPASGTEQTPTTIADTYRTVATSSDPRGDHGAQGPAYADLVTLRVDRGTRTMRFVVDVAGDLPAALAAGEVQGVGVDLFRGLGLESAYQVFVDGGSDGWRAFFQRGTEFVAYPGTFRLGGGRLELVVSLDAFTEGAPERVSAFADWSHRTDAGTRNSEDLLPELGSVAIGS